MALELDPILAEAQDGQTHRPIIEILSSPAVSGSLLLGQRLTSGADSENSPNQIILNSGRLAGLYVSGTDLHYTYTNPDRTEFHDLILDMFPGMDGIFEASLCELSDGNVGVIWFADSGGDRMMLYLVISPTGEQIYTDDPLDPVPLRGVIDSGALGSLASPFVLTIGENEYIYFYIKLSEGNYSICRRTSTDFLEWSEEFTCSIDGLTAANRIANLSAIRLTTGQIWLFFDYVQSVSGTNELLNVFYSISNDDGDNWSEAANFTNYNTYGVVGSHAYPIQNTAGQMKVLFYQLTQALHMDADTDGYCSSSILLTPTDFSLDTVNKKLYVTSVRASGGGRALGCVFRIDTETMTIDACWNDISAPAFRPHLFEGTAVGISKYRGAGPWVPVSLGNHIDLLNGEGEAGTISHFDFENWPEKGITANVLGFSPPAGGGSWILTHVFIDRQNLRMYVLFINSYVYTCGIYIGYFDLTEAGASKTFYPVVSETGQVTEYDLYALSDTGYGDFVVLPTESLIIVSMGTSIAYTGSDWTGRLKIWELSSGAVYKDYKTNLQPSFPYHGLRRIHYKSGKIYGGFTYEGSISGEADKRGLCCVELNSDSITFKRPTYATEDEYGLGDITETDDGRLMIVAEGFGVASFNMSTEVWAIANNTTLPGMDPSGSNLYKFLRITFDPVSGLVVTGSYYNSFLAAFSPDGAIKQILYTDGTLNGSWVWLGPALLVPGIRETDPVAVYGPGVGEGSYVFWVSQVEEDTFIKWAREEGSAFDLSPYLVRGKDVSIKWTITGAPARLEFTLAKGDLFDPTNAASLWSGFLRKGRKITVRAGERVGGVNKWAPQGVFYNSEPNMPEGYERRKYPTIKVVAEDKKAVWKRKKIIATDSNYYASTPEDFLTYFLIAVLGGDPDDVIIPAFDNSTIMTGAQWVESMAQNILDQICNHFGYFFQITAEGKYSARKISDQNPVDHVYPSNEKVKNFRTDFSYSDWTNQVVVVGRENTEIELLFPEERIQALSGHVGWYGYNNEFYVYYSNDHSRRCRNPRLHVLESATSIAFELAGKIDESISYLDPNETYLIVRVHAPNLTPVLLAALGIAVAGYFMADGVFVTAFGAGGGWTIPVGRRVEQVGIMLALMILASQGNFQYEIFAQPVGKVRRSVQNTPGTGDDVEFQQEFGETVTEKVEDSLCGSVQECDMVAAHRILVHKLQRNRVIIKKVSHLQDEVADTIQIPHPKSGLDLKTFAAELTRTWTIGKSGDLGRCRDEIEGWKL